jgi:hypothetical protein
MATEFTFTTVRQVAAQLGVTTNRVRQLIAELRETTGREIGRIVGQVRLLTPAEANSIIRHHSQKRGYTRP